MFVGQSRPLGPSDCNNNELRKATRHLGQLFDGIMEPSGLGAAQHGLLVHIDLMNEPTMTTLASVLVMDLSALSRTLKPLMRDGYVTLRQDEEDGRVKRVLITAEGKHKLEETKKLWRKAQTRVETVLGSEKALLLRQLLSEMASDSFGEAFRQGRTIDRVPSRDAR